MCLRPVLDSFLLMSFAPPQMITKSPQCSWLNSLHAKRMIYSGLEPGITAPITSKIWPSDVESSAAQPPEWLSPMIKTLFLCIIIRATLRDLHVPWSFKPMTDFNKSIFWSVRQNIPLPIVLNDYGPWTCNFREYFFKIMHHVVLNYKMSKQSCVRC